MRTITTILLAVIAIIGVVAIIIVKLYYKDKNEEDEIDFEKELNIKHEFMPIPEGDIKNRSIDRRIRRNAPKKEVYDKAKMEEIEKFTRNAIATGEKGDMINDYFNEPIVNKDKKIDSIDDTKTKVETKSEETSKTPKSEEIKEILKENEKSKDIKTSIQNINDVNIGTVGETEANAIATKISQDPMTTEQKAFIENHKKGRLIIDESSRGIKIIKNISPNQAPENKIGEIKNINFNESKESLEFKEKMRKANENIITPVIEEEPMIIDIPETTETENEESSEEVETKKDTSEIDSDSVKETFEEILENSNIEKTPIIEETIQEIMKDVGGTDVETTETEETKSEETEEEITTETEETKSEETEEEITTETEETESEEVEEEDSEDVETTEIEEIDIEEEIPSNPESDSYIDELPIFTTSKSKNGETTLDDHQPQGYVDDIPTVANLETKEEDEEEEYDDVITPIYNDTKKVVNGAVKTLQNLRSNLFNEGEDEYEGSLTVEDVTEETLSSFREEEYDDFVSITPLSEEEIREELKEETATINPIIYEEETVQEIIDENSDSESSATEDSSERPKKERKIKRIELSEPKTKGEQIILNGQIHELKKGQTALFSYNNETYSSTILALKPGHIGVKYRGKNLWIKNSRIKKIFK